MYWSIADCIMNYLVAQLNYNTVSIIFKVKVANYHETMVCIQLFYCLMQFSSLAISLRIRNGSSIIYFGDDDGQSIMGSAYILLLLLLLSYHSIVCLVWVANEEDIISIVQNPLRSIILIIISESATAAGLSRNRLVIV